MRPVTRLQALLSTAASPSTIQAFRLAQVKARVPFILALAAEAARVVPSDIDRLRGALNELLITYDGGADVPCMSRIQTEITSFVGGFRHAGCFKRQAGAQSYQRLPVEILLDRLQYNAAGLRTLVAHRLPPNADNDVATSGSYVRRCSLSALLVGVLRQLEPFCIEKFGVCPPTRIELDYAKASQTLTALHSTDELAEFESMHGAREEEAPFFLVGVPDFAAFAMTELIKNAYYAAIQRYTAAGVDDAPPITLVLAASPHWATFRVSDRGLGYRQLAAAVTEFSYFNSDAETREQPNYQYSREFGVPFSGLGLGLVRANLYARYHGGSVALLSCPGYGVVAQASFERSGTVGSDIW